MKKVIGIVVGALVCSLAATAFAFPTQQSTESISRIGVDATLNQAFLFSTDGLWDGATCTSNNTLIIDISTEGGRQMYHAALAAYLAGRQVMAFYSSCRGTLPQADRIDVLP
jgi:hypothetical protein